MLGQTRRTTRTDVALALSTAGFIFLAWVLACASAKNAAMAISAMGPTTDELTGISAGFMRVFAGRWRHVLDIIGPLWLMATLWMVIHAARQRRIISWSWLLCSIQGFFAILIASWASFAQAKVTLGVTGSTEPMPDWFCATIAIAVLIWLGTLAVLITERHRLKRKSVLSVSAKTQSFR